VDTGSTMLMSAQSDIPMGGYACFKILGRVYIVGMAVLCRKCPHGKWEGWSENGNSFGGGMAWGAGWEHVEVAT